MSSNNIIVSANRIKSIEIIEIINKFSKKIIIKEQ